MSELTPSSTDTGERSKNPTSSLLADILKASEGGGSKSGKGAPVEIKPGTENPPPKKPREPISLATFAKLLGSLVFISIIFFGSFLAYIAFNPSQAVFFTRTFNIDPNDVQNLLKKLINGTFGFVMIIVSVLWIITLFRAFWVPKELKRKRLLSWLTAGVVGIVLFLILAFWGYLFTVVKAGHYDNPDGAILIYDQNLYTNDKFKPISRIYNTTNLIGPVDIFFDIRGNAELVETENLYTIDSFNISFDGARCADGKTSIQGTRPQTEQSIVCTFDEIKPYNLIGSYTVHTREGEVKTVPIVLPSIEIRGLVNIKKQTNNRGQKIITFDANSLKKLGSPRWIYQNGKETTEPTITESITSISQGLCLRVFESTGCDRLFILEDKNNKAVDGSISVIQDRTDKNIFQFSLSGVNLNPNEIVNIEWLLDGQNIICKGNAETCNYTFTTYGRKILKASIEVANGEKYNFETELMVNEPLSVIRHVKVVNTAGVLVNDDNTFDNGLNEFVLKNAIIPPESLTFDARDVVSGNPGYTLDTVLWTISNGKTTEERRGDKITIEFNQPLRYTIDALYTFKKSIPGEKDVQETIKESVVIDIERRSLMPRMTISTTSDYVPTLATIDASQSESENGEIKKFIFDFGEGKPPAEGDAIQQYQYTTPGEKNITLTIIAENGDKTSLKKTIVLKDQVKTIDFTPSMQTGIVGNTIDFEAMGTTGQIEDYVWNFGDNTPVSRGYTTSHTFTKAGTYSISLTIIYSDGTQQTKKKNYEVIESL